MSKFQEFLTRQRDHLDNAIFTSPVDPRIPVTKFARDIFDKSKLENGVLYQALVNLSTKPWGPPGQRLARRLSDRYFDASNTPLRGITDDEGRIINAPELIAYGGENFVFLHKPDDVPPLILKIDKRSLRLSGDQLVERAKQIKSQHEQIREWYKDIPNFVVPTHFFIGRLPFKNKLGVGSTQEYFPEAKDLFNDFTDTELVDIFTQDEKLRINFQSFFDKFFTILSETGQSIDIVGHQNLCLVKGEQGNYELRLLDAADIKHQDEEQEAFRFAIRESKRTKLRMLNLQLAAIPGSS